MNHLAQLRHDIEKFNASIAEIMILVPNGPFMIKRYLSKHPSDFTILTDKGAKVAAQYFQVKQFFAVGTSTVFVVDQTGKITYAYYAKSALEEPGNDSPLAVLAAMESRSTNSNASFL
ncbi:MAG: redoxin domain-containing protein [Brevefilum sp.]|nr:redoxin domain-containing protein [Brevefilum sp.]